MRARAERRGRGQRSRARPGADRRRRLDRPATLALDRDLIDAAGVRIGRLREAVARRAEVGAAARSADRQAGDAAQDRDQERGALAPRDAAGEVSNPGQHVSRFSRYGMPAQRPPAGDGKDQDRPGVTRHISRFYWTRGPAVQ
jgi:hypothetical protein